MFCLIIKQRIIQLVLHFKDETIKIKNPHELLNKLFANIRVFNNLRPNF